MKKIIALVCSLLIILSSFSSVFADTITVSIDSAEGKPTYVSVVGKTSDDCTAVVIEVLDGSTIIAMETKEVNNKLFNTTILANLVVGNTYTIRVANYDGGPWQTKEFVAKENVSSSPSKSKYSIPNTGIE